MDEETKVLLLVDGICYALTGIPLIAIALQSFFSLGAFLYALWLNYSRGYGSLKGDFVECSSLLNRLCALCVYVVILLMGLYSVNMLAWHFSTKYELLSQIHLQLRPRLPLLGTFWDFITVGAMLILPTIFFPFLGGLARNVKAEELGRVRRLLSEASSHEERSYLTLYMSQVMGSLKVTSVADYLVRIVLSAYLGLFMAKALAWL
jgi:hypothetical protein